MLTIDADLRSRHRGLNALVITVNELTVEDGNAELENFKTEVREQLRRRWTLEKLIDEPIFRAYRDFFWRIGIDPTKVRPAAEALIRRLLRGHSLPKINTFVDTYNLASIQTGIAIAAFDADQIGERLVMREAQAGKQFLGIGMDKPLTMNGGEIVIDDGDKLIAVYPYRDADISKITLHTRRSVILICGVPGIKDETLSEAAKMSTEYITRFCRAKTAQSSNARLESV